MLKPSHILYTQGLCAIKLVVFACSSIPFTINIALICTTAQRTQICCVTCPAPFVHLIERQILGLFWPKPVINQHWAIFTMTWEHQHLSISCELCAYHAIHLKLFQIILRLFYVSMCWSLWFTIQAAEFQHINIRICTKLHIFAQFELFFSSIFSLYQTTVWVIKAWWIKYDTKKKHMQTCFYILSKLLKIDSDSLKVTGFKRLKSHCRI